MQHVPHTLNTVEPPTQEQFNQDTDEDTSSLKTQSKALSACKMDKRNSDVGLETSHRCGRSCLGPLTFHPRAVGDEVRLSHGGRFAERTESTFKNGLVFSSRPVKVQERIHLRVEKNSYKWDGAMRLGFTNVPPSDRPLPLPVMAIPDLTAIRGHWARPVPDTLCQGSELEFWVSGGGTVYVTIMNMNIRKHKLLKGVDLSKPLWAMIDIYGRTSSILLLGSEKRSKLCTKWSCPAPEFLTSPDADNHYSMIPHVSRLHGNSDECISSLGLKVPADGGTIRECVVCMVNQATITLLCDHRCLCNRCAPEFFQQYDTCPLCRQNFDADSTEIQATENTVSSD